jgi:ubiquinone/menaquinone biosynthesis C-methylase UbiE
MAADRFDAQARTFDERAGIPPDAARAVARAVLDVLEPEPDDLLLELGAGTGEIGRHLAGSMNYVGLDGSSAMLDTFLAKLGSRRRARASLVKADADRSWPVDDGTVRAVFASRVAHLLEPDHLIAELWRVCEPGGYFLIGHVARDRSSVHRILRDKRELLLRERGLSPREGRQMGRRVLDGLVAAGATRIETRPVAIWSAQASVDQVINRWVELETMGGDQLNADVRSAILAELTDWATGQFGDLTTMSISEERYMLGGVRLKERTSTTHC